MADTLTDPLDALVWPSTLLKPAAIEANPVPFSRSGGRALGGQQRSTRTDRGWWSIGYKGVVLSDAARRRQWNLIRTYLGGTAGLIAVPVWSFDSAPWAAGAVDGRLLSTHSDGSGFSDGSSYSQSAGPFAQMAATAALGATSVTLRLVSGIDELAGVRFSYQHALYETGAPTLVAGDEWTVPVTPAIRAEIPADADLEMAMPTCLVHLASDKAMDAMLSRGNVDRVDVSFVEANDFWSDLAV